MSGFRAMGRRRGLAVVVLGVVLAAYALAGSGRTHDLFEHAVTSFLRAVAHGIEVAPALMLGLIMLSSIPIMAITARLLQWYATPRRPLRHRIGVSNAGISGNTAAAGCHAFLELIDSNKKFAIVRDMLRIGREEDNDIRIPSGGVQGYHAAIYREDFGDYRITSLLDKRGGVIVNGQQCEEVVLHDGDIIDLGPGRLKFHAGRV